MLQICDLFTLDLVQTQSQVDNWIIIEVGDGQVSGIQDASAVRTIYESFSAY